MALPSGDRRVDDMRIFRNSGGKAKGDPLGAEDIVYKHLWYLAIIDPAVEPEYPDPDHPLPDSHIGGWNDVSSTAVEAAQLSDDGIDGPQ